MSIPCPQDLGNFSTFHRTFIDFENKDELVAYACLLYTVSKIIKRENITPELKKYVSISLDRLETWKKEFEKTNYNEIISNESILSSHISNVANKMFSWAESKDESKCYEMDVIQTYYMSSVLFVVSEHFSKDDENKDDDLKRKFAMQRSLHLKKCLKSNNPPADIDTFCSAFDTSVGITKDSIINDPLLSTNVKSPQNMLDFDSHFNQKHQQSNLLPQKCVNSNNMPYSSNSSSSNRANQKYFENKSNQNNNNWDTTVLDFETSQQAQKYIKHAGSALSFDDINTTVDLLTKALNLLKPFAAN